MFGWVSITGRDVAGDGLPVEDVCPAMTAQRPSLGPAHFRRLYDANPDPWRFRTSAYEQAKYRKTIAALQNRSFSSAFEVGCSIGVLTRLLAPHCKAMLAVDIIEQPLTAARAACADQPWVRFERMQVPRQWPNGTFDLVVLSEVLYFLSPADIVAVADLTARSLVPNGLALLVNWCGRSDDPCTGEQAVRAFMQRTRDRLVPRTQFSEPAVANGRDCGSPDRLYRLDLLVRR
jgi:predicted TPR repeat methyltransferase